VFLVGWLYFVSVYIIMTDETEQPWVPFFIWEREILPLVSKNELLVLRATCFTLKELASVDKLWKEPFLKFYKKSPTVHVKDVRGEHRTCQSDGCPPAWCYIHRPFSKIESWLAHTCSLAECNIYSHYHWERVEEKLIEMPAEDFLTALIKLKKLIYKRKVQWWVLKLTRKSVQGPC
jgi:hypothetical protein